MEFVVAEGIHSVASSDRCAVVRSAGGEGNLHGMRGETQEQPLRSMGKGFKELQWITPSFVASMSHASD